MDTIVDVVLQTINGHDPVPNSPWEIAAVKSEAIMVRAAQLRAGRPGMVLYEKDYKTAPKGKPFEACYDVVKLVPTEEYLKVYDEAVKILTELGLDYWQKK